MDNNYDGGYSRGGMYNRAAMGSPDEEEMRQRMKMMGGMTRSTATPPVIMPGQTPPIMATPDLPGAGGVAGMPPQQKSVGESTNMIQDWKQAWGDMKGMGSDIKSVFS